MEFVCRDKNKVLWVVVGDHVVEEATDHEDIGVWDFDFNVFDQYEEGVVREVSSEFPCLLILIYLWPGNWKTHLKRMNQNVD